MAEWGNFQWQLASKRAYSNQRGAVWRGAVWRGAVWRGAVWRGGYYKQRYYCFNSDVTVSKFKFISLNHQAGWENACSLKAFQQWSGEGVKMKGNCILGRILIACTGSLTQEVLHFK
jgi:hypothetical protein